MVDLAGWSRYLNINELQEWEGYLTRIVCVCVCERERENCTTKQMTVQSLQSEQDSMKKHALPVILFRYESTTHHGNVKVTV